MKQLLIKLLFMGRPPNQYPTVRIPRGKIVEKVFLKNGKAQLEITENHSIVCQSPFCIAVWIDKDLESFRAGTSLVLVKKGAKIVSRLEVNTMTVVEGNDYSITIFKIQKAENLELSFILKKALDWKFNEKTNLTLLESEIYGALYAYPRGIILVSFKSENYYNIFPMDFQGYYAEKEIYILGLRTTNITVDKIIEHKKVVVCVTDDTDIPTIYGLGKHHGTNPPDMDKLGFDVVESELFGFPVPAFSKCYKEIEIINHFKVGSHIMLVGKVLNDYARSDRPTSLYHLHGFHPKNRNYESI